MSAAPALAPAPAPSPAPVPSSDSAPSARGQRRSLAALVAVALAVAPACGGCQGSAPRGAAGPDADALVRKIQARVDVAAFEATGAVAFSFRGSRHWLWDKARGMVRMTDGDQTVLLDVWDQGGVAFRGTAQLADTDAASALQGAWSAFINDSFWLFPFASFDNDGVSREIVNEDGRPALLIRYASGGVTPGDSYLYIVDDTGLPTAWKMWVSVLPVPGFTTSWESWVTLPTGALVATGHAGPGGARIDLGDVRGAAELGALLAAHPALLEAAGAADGDPFAPLARRRAG